MTLVLLSPNLGCLLRKMNIALTSHQMIMFPGTEEKTQCVWWKVRDRTIEPWKGDDSCITPIVPSFFCVVSDFFQIKQFYDSLHCVESNIILLSCCTGKAV